MDDIDFDAGTIMIREKKRDRSREMTFRTVPMATGLKDVLRAWLEADHPGGPYTICGRGGRPLTRQMMTKAFRVGRGRVLLAERPGLPRASAFVRQQLRPERRRSAASSTTGWGTRPRRCADRYSHLFPDQQQAAIRSVFG